VYLCLVHAVHFLQFLGIEGGDAEAWRTRADQLVEHLEHNVGFVLVNQVIETFVDYGKAPLETFQHSMIRARLFIFSHGLTGLYTNECALFFYERNAK
jgi:hypothetical protein